MPADSAPARKGPADYLVRMLQLNPAAASDQIIAIRSRALRLAPRDQAAGANARSSAARRASVLRRLEQIRTQCWTASPADLLAQLAALPVDDLPDLSQAVRRLQVLVHNRPLLPQLATHRDFDGDLFSSLKKVLAGSSRETSVVREQTVSRFRSAHLRKRGRRMIKLLKRQAPALYELESNWFESLLRQKESSVSRAEKRQLDESMGDNSSSDVPWWVWWLLVGAVLRILRFFMSNG